MSSKISAILIVKNEEKNIEVCLESVKWADEIIIVDAHSTDKTVDIARKFTNKIILQEWLGYSKQKNAALSYASNEWVLSIDADERVSDDLKAEIKKILDGISEVNGYYIPIKNYYFGKFLRYGGFYPDYHLRLFKKNKGIFESKVIAVHEGLNVKGSIGHLKNPIIHIAYRNIKGYFEKFNKYTTMEAEGWFAHGRKPSGYTMVFKPFYSFIKRYILKAGFLDGIAGFLACIFSSFYIFVFQLKLLELHGFQNKNINLLTTLLKRK